MVHLSYLHNKKLLMKLVSEYQQTYANLLLGWKLAYYTPTQCVKPCLPVFIHVAIQIRTRLDSRLNKTRPAALKKRSCPDFNKQDSNVKTKSSTLQADKRKLTISVLMGFVRLATLSLRQWVAFTTFILVKKHITL